MKTARNQSMQPDEINQLLLEKLLKIFTIVNDWLKYAEAKNGLILAFCGASISAITTFLVGNYNSHQQIVRMGIIISLSLFYLSSIILIISFLPKTNGERLIFLCQSLTKTTFFKRIFKLTNTSSNLYFFEYLKQYVDDKNKPQPYKLINEFAETYLHQNYLLIYNREVIDLSIQIINNSNIVSVKFTLSNYSITIILIATIIILFSIIVFFFI